MEGTSVDDSNEGIIPVADDVDKIYPRSPGIRFTFILLSWKIIPKRLGHNRF